MRKIVVILVCLLLFVSCLPLFAKGHRGGHHGSPGSHQAANEHRGHDGHHGSSDSHQAASGHRADNPHRWHGSTRHPSFHGWRGWGRAPGVGPVKPADDPPKPPDDPVEDPGDKPGTDPVGTPGDKGGGDPLEKLLILDPRTGSFPG
jgi:hypothetical protein